MPMTGLFIFLGLLAFGLGLVRWAGAQHADKARQQRRQLKRGLKTLRRVRIHDGSPPRRLLKRTRRRLTVRRQPG